MLRILKPSQRLIVSADYKPPSTYGRVSVRDQILNFADKLEGTEVYLKVNSALRACGYDLISEIQARGLKVFADLKLCDIKATLAIDGALLRETKPELLTVMCTAGLSGMHALKTELPDTEVLGVTVLTNFFDSDTQTLFACSTETAVLRFARLAIKANLNGLISSPKEVGRLREVFGATLSLNTPGIRPAWYFVPSDDQNPDRVMSPYQAIKSGADRVIVGRPITQAEYPYDAVMRTIDEIVSALS